MRKLFGVFVLGMLMFSMGISLVSAGAVEEIQDGVADGYELIRPVLEEIIGETSGGDFFLAKVLFLIIIFAVVWMALKKVSFFSENEWVLWIVSIAVPILAIRWVGNADVVKTVILPYSALGVALTAGLPFVLYFLIVKDFHKTLWKIAWIFFMVVFIGLWIMRSGEGAAETVGVGAFAWIYLATAGLALITMLSHKQIKKVSRNMEGEKREAVRKSEDQGKLDRKKNDLRDDVMHGGLDMKSEDYKNRAQAIKDKQKELDKR